MGGNGGPGIHALDDIDALRGTRVLAFCDHFSPTPSGGSERVALEVYQRLARRGVRVTVVTTGTPYHSDSGEVDGVSVRWLRAFDLSGILGAQVTVAPTALRQARRIADAFRPHVLHANTLYFQTSLAAALLQRRRQIPLVTTVHIGTIQHLAQPIRSLTAAYERTAGQLILRRSSGIIAVSESVRQHLLSLGTDPGRIEVVFNGVDLLRFHPPTERVDTLQPPLLMFVGRLIANKGADIFVDALQQLHRQAVRYRAAVLGDGPLRARLQRRIEKEGLGGIVQFVGHTSNVADELRLADILVRPSLTEGMPLTVLEAMASGVCVVASNIPGNLDLIRDEENGVLVPVGSAHHLAAALMRLLQDHSLRGRLAAAGLRTAQHYSWDRCAEGTARVLGRASITPRVG